MTTAAEFWSQFEATRPLRDLISSPEIVVKQYRQLPDGLWFLDLDGAAIRDLSVFKGVPLAELFIHSTQVADLTPLQGMKLRGLHLFNTRVTDLRPLAGMPLTYLNLVGTGVADITPLAGMPLTELKLNHCSQLTDVSPLKQCPTLRSVTLPDGASDFEFLRNFPQLERLSFREDERWLEADLQRQEFWSNWDDHDRALSPSAGPGSLTRGNAPGRILKLATEGAPVANLEPIRSLNHPSLRHLRIVGGRITDLSPLQGMNFHSLVLARNLIADIAPIRGMHSLQELALDGCKVKDITPIEGLPIKKLLLNDCSELLDLGPLATVPSLEKVAVPRQARNVESLRRLPNLKLLAYGLSTNSPWDPDTTAKDFWTEYDANALPPQDAIARLAALSAKNPKDAIVVVKIATLQAWFGHETDPATTCAAAFAEAENTNDPFIAERWAKARLLGATADKQRIAAVGDGPARVERGKDNQFLPYFRMVLGMAEYRSGRYEAAEAELVEAATAGNSIAHVAATTAFFRAMCQHRLGNTDEARKLAAFGVSKMLPLPEDAKRPFADLYFDDVIAAIAYREAKALIKFDETPRTRGMK